MVIGDKGKIAIEYELEEPLTRHLLGHICFWIKGIQIGDYDVIAPLGVTGVACEKIIRRAAWRRDQRLLMMDKFEVMRMLRAAVYPEEGEDDQERIARELGIDHIEGADLSLSLAAELTRYFLAPHNGEAFDDWYLVLVENELHDRLIWSQQPRGGVEDAFVPHGEFSRLCEIFASQIEEKWQTIMGTPEGATVRERHTDRN